jgi:hypothetical protein
LPALSNGRALKYGTTNFAIDPHVKKSPSDTNRNQLFVLRGIYELPFGKNKMFLNNTSRWVNYFVGGWQLAGTTTLVERPAFHPYLRGCGQAQDVDSNFGSPVPSATAVPMCSPPRRIRAMAEQSRYREPATS